VTEAGRSEPPRAPTLRDVASAAGVPLSAASLVLNGKSGVSLERRERILEAVRSLQYVPQQKKLQVRKRTPVIGLIMETLSPAAAQDGFMAEVVSGVEDGLRSRGMQMLLQLYRPHDDPIHQLRSLRGGDVDGVIVANGGDVDQAVVHRIMSSGAQVVLLENYMDMDTDIHAVVADNFTAGYRSTEYLLNLGHRRIGMIVGSHRYISLIDRRRGFEAALLEHGIVPDPSLMPAQEPKSTRKGYQQMRALLELAERPTAVYAVSDKSAMGAYAAVHEAGLSIPDDISIVGTDDVMESGYMNPPLTTFVVPKFELGRAASQMMAAILSDDPPAASRMVLHGSLQRRKSAAPPPGLIAR
jgi:DNA-binding LacI/PurR family transcriptional regulator